MCTHAASERERQRERREDRPVTNPIRISARGIDSAQLPLVFGYQFLPDTNPRDRARERSPVTNSVRLPSRGKRASGYRLPIRAIKGNGTPKDGQAGRRFRRLLRRASNPTHWRVVLYRFFGGKVRVSAFWRSLYHRPFSSAGQHFFAFSIYRFRNFFWAHFSTCGIQAVSSWLHKLLQFIDTCLQCFCWFRIGLKCDAWALVQNTCSSFFCFRQVHASGQQLGQFCVVQVICMIEPFLTRNNVTENTLCFGSSLHIRHSVSINILGGCMDILQAVEVHARSCPYRN